MSELIPKGLRNITVGTAIALATVTGGAEIFGNLNHGNWPPGFLWTNQSGDLMLSDTGNPDIKISMGKSQNDFNLSPDGQRVIFVLSSPLANELHIINTNGGKSKRLTSDIMSATSPRWSPDSKLVVFECWTPNADEGICTINPDVNESINFFTMPQMTAALAPMWSPDGTQITYIRRSHLHDEIWTMNLDGTNDHPIILGGDVGLGNIAYSKDGKIVYTYGLEIDRSYIYIFNPKNGKNIPLTPDNNDILDFNPQWSPDGTKILFLRMIKNGKSGIYISNSDGTNQQLVVPDIPGIDEAAWLPDGNSISFLANKNGIDEINIFDLTTKQYKSITQRSQDVASPPTWWNK